MRKQFLIEEVSYTFEDYSKIVTREERIQFRENAIQKLIKANKANYSSVKFPYEVWDIVQEWEKQVETLPEKLERLCSSMDWTYEYSDDHRVWWTNNEKLQTINSLVKKLGKNGEQILKKYRK